MTRQERYLVHGRALIYGAALLSCFGIDPMGVLVLVGVGTMATIYGAFWPASHSAVEQHEPPSGLTVEDITIVPPG